MSLDSATDSTPALPDALAESAGQSRWLGPRFWMWIWAPLGIVSVFKSLRVPNLWAYTQSRFIYPGARRRSLLGHLLGLLHAHSYLAFSAFSAWVLVFLWLAAGLLIWRSGLLRSGAAMLTAVFATSFAVTYSVHLIGYTDNAVLLITIVALLLRKRMALYLPAAVAAVVFCLRVHENALFFALPLLLLPPLLDVLQPDKKASLPLAWISIAAISTASVTLLAYLVPPPLTFQQAQHLSAQMQQSVPFPLFPELALVQSASLSLVLHYMLNYYFTLAYWMDMAQAALAMLPSAGLFLWCSWRALHGRRWPQLACVAASLAPLLLHLLGWDVYRWDGLAVWTSFLTLVVVASRVELRLTPVLRNIAILLMILNAAAGPGLLNNEGLHGFPEFRRLPVALRMLAARPQHSASPDQPPPETQGLWRR